MQSIRRSMKSIRGFYKGIHQIYIGIHEIYEGNHVICKGNPSHLHRDLWLDGELICYPSISLSWLAVPGWLRRVTCLSKPRQPATRASHLASQPGSQPHSGQPGQIPGPCRASQVASKPPGPSSYLTSQPGSQIATCPPAQLARESSPK